MMSAGDISSQHCLSEAAHTTSNSAPCDQAALDRCVAAFQWLEAAHRRGSAEACPASPGLCSACMLMESPACRASLKKATSMKDNTVFEVEKAPAADGLEAGSLVSSLPPLTFGGKSLRIPVSPHHPLATP